MIKNHCKIVANLYIQVTVLSIFQEPVEKKKRKILPQFSPSSPPRSPPSPTKSPRGLDMDEDYSDWTPPSGKIWYMDTINLSPLWK